MELIELCPKAQVLYKSPCNAGDTEDVGSIPGPGRSPGEANGNPLQYSCLENLMDRGALRATVPEIARAGLNLTGTCTFLIKTNPDY